MRRAILVLCPFLAAAVFAAALATRCEAQAGGPVWISIDGSQAGTPANLTLDPQASSPERSVLELVVHGFWMTPRQGTDGLTYQQLSVPGLTTLGTVGAPELPIARFALGLVTDAPGAVFAGAQVEAQTSYPGILPWPHPIGAIPDTFPRPEIFVRDPVIYGQPIDYPGGYAEPFSGVERGGGVNTSACEIHPFRWNASGLLTVTNRARFTFDHPGVPSPVQVGSPMAGSFALERLANKGVVAPWVSWDAIMHHGYFLFVTPSEFDTELAPLIDQKKKRGFWVTTIHTEDIPAPSFGQPACSQVRLAIQNWYAGTPTAADHFCILVGDANQIWPCTVSRPAGYELGTTLPTDDLFGDADGNGVDDMGKEVYVGRLSPVDGADLDAQVARILAYEDKPSPQQEFDHAALVAWNSNDDNRFLKAMNVVQAASYASVTPTFDLVDGGLPWTNNTWIDGVAMTDGIVAYNGHGGSSNWWNWDRSHQDYDISSVGSLVNHPVNPIVWSLACYTGNLYYNDCLGERWMSGGTDGAVSFYGATRPSWIYDNGIMVRRLFDAVFNHAFTTQGIAIAFQEFGTILDTSTDNPVQYLLLGDPEMRIRRTNVPNSVPYIPDLPIYVVAGPITPIDIHVGLPSGSPAVGVKVSLWKSGILAGANGASGADGPVGDQVLDNRYTDAAGNAHFDLAGLTPGTLYVTTTDDEGNVVEKLVGVTGMASVAPGAGAASLRVASSISRGQVHFLLGGPLDRDARLLVCDISGRTVRSLRAPAGAHELTWDGADETGARAAAGLYLAKLEHAGERGASKPVRLVLLR